jgi:hypothetical protein
VQSNNIAQKSALGEKILLLSIKNNMDTSTVTTLCEGYGWTTVLSNNPNMISFRKISEDGEPIRMNIYNNGTVQIQIGTGYNGGRILKNVDINTLEDILIDYE